MLQDSEAYECLVCKDKQRATKEHVIYKAPPILILTLQRFKSGRKNTDLIRYPIFGLDIAPYVVSGKNDSLYDLYGIVHHYGALGGGHYTASCFN